MERRLDAWAALMGGNRGLAEMVLQVAAPFPPGHVPPDAWLTEGYRGKGPQPLEKLPAAALFRLRLAGGRTRLRDCPYANVCPEILASASRLIFYFELSVGFIPHRKGEPVAISRFGWIVKDGRAIPICPAIFEFWADPRWCCAPRRLGALNAFTGELFDIAAIYGSRSPDQYPKGWHGTSERYVERWSYPEPPPISKKDRRDIRTFYKPTKWLAPHGEP